MPGNNEGVASRATIQVPGALREGRKRASTRSLALPLRSPSNEMEFSGERSESAATTG